MAKSTKPQTQDYPILCAFRLNGAWHHESDGTIPLTPSQASLLVLNGKVGLPPRASRKQEAN